MATLGNSTAPSATNWNDSIASNREFWNHDSYTMPAGGGVATDMYVYVGGYGMTSNFQFCIWDGSGNLVWNSSATPFSSTIAWKHISIPNKYLAAGSYELGFYVANGQNVQWYGDNVTANNVYTKTGLSGPSANTSGSNEYGSNNYGGLGIYVTYTPGGVGHVRRSGAWSAGTQPKVRRSGAWAAATGCGSRRTSAWTQAT